MHDATALDAVHHAVVAAVAAAFVALAVALLLLLWRKKRMVLVRGGGAHGFASPDEADPAAQLLPLPVVPLADVERATDGFHSSRVIGQGPHFTIYALAGDAQEELAAKRMRPHLILGDPGGRRFPPAVRSLPVLPPHRNLAAIVGLSEGPGERVLLVQRAPAGSLGLHALLHDDKHPVVPLTWLRRAAVAAGAARGLAHLHAHGVPHGRVRPCNVLVAGAGSHAVVSDYGLAGFLHDGRGRLDVRAENDVYMFGALLLEILTGRRWDGGRLADWALPLIRRGGVGVLAEDQVLLLDSRAGKAEPTRLLARMARVALACVGNNDARSRPGMAEVSAILDDVEAAYGRCRDDGAREVDDGNERLSGCLLGPSRSAHKAEMLLRPTPV